MNMDFCNLMKLRNVRYLAMTTERRQFNLELSINLECIGEIKTRDRKISRDEDGISPLNAMSVH